MEEEAEEAEEAEEDTFPWLQLMQSLPAVWGARLLRIVVIKVRGRMWRWVSCRRGRHGEERGGLGGGGGEGGRVRICKMIWRVVRRNAWYAWKKLARNMRCQVLSAGMLTTTVLSLTHIRMIHTYFSVSFSHTHTYDTYIHVSLKCRHAYHYGTQHTHKHTHTHTYKSQVQASSIDMYNNDVGKKSAQKFMNQTGDLKAATLYFAS
jgi:hypothetical protein